MSGEVWYENGRRKATPEYRAWQNMKNRCCNPKSQDYRHYGGRGIQVCETWLKSPEAFIADMGRRPSPEYTLDREDVDGDYCKENCRWVTRETQARNRRYATTKAWELAIRLGVKASTAHHMIWQVRAKDRGNTRWFELSQEAEAKVRQFLAGVPA